MIKLINVAEQQIGCWIMVLIHKFSFAVKCKLSVSSNGIKYQKHLYVFVD